MIKKDIILVSGSMAYDKIMDFNGRFKDHIMADKIHALSVSFVVDKVRINFGGTAGNIAYNLKLLGLKPIILSQAGENDFRDYAQWLKKNNITIKGIGLFKKMNTASAHIITDLDDNQITALHLETMGRPIGLTEKKIKSFGKVALAIVAPGNISDMLAAARIYKKLKIPYVADPGQQIPAFKMEQLEELIRGAKALVCNDYEMALIIKILKYKNIKIIQNLVEILVITYGAKGSVIYSGSKKVVIKACRPKSVVDPTGAGDAYRAGLIYGLNKGWDLKKIGELAAWVAKHPVAYYGTQEHKFKIDSWDRYVG